MKRDAVERSLADKARVERARLELHEIMFNSVDRVIYTALRSVSRNHSYRRYSVYIATPQGLEQITWHVSLLTGLPLKEQHLAYTVGIPGGGMDMALALADNINGIFGTDFSKRDI